MKATRKHTFLDCEAITAEENDLCADLWGKLAAHFHYRLVENQYYNSLRMNYTLLVLVSTMCMSVEATAGLDPRTFTDIFCLNHGFSPCKQTHTLSVLR